MIDGGEFDETPRACNDEEPEGGAMAAIKGIGERPCGKLSPRRGGERNVDAEVHNVLELL